MNARDTITLLFQVCRKKPPYSRHGKSYPTCGYTCAALLLSQRSAYHGRGESSSSRGGFPSTRRTVVAATPTLPRDQNPPASAINPAINHLFQHLGGHRQQSTLDSQSAGDAVLSPAQAPAPPTFLCVVRAS